MQEFDAAVGGSGVEGASGLGRTDGAVGGLEVRSAFDAFDADGAVGAGDALELDALRDADEVARATAAAPARRIVRDPIDTRARPRQGSRAAEDSNQSAWRAGPFAMIASLQTRSARFSSHHDIALALIQLGDQQVFAIR